MEHEGSYRLRQGVQTPAEGKQWFRTGWRDRIRFLKAHNWVIAAVSLAMKNWCWPGFTPSTGDDGNPIKSTACSYHRKQKQAGGWARAHLPPKVRTRSLISQVGPDSSGGSGELICWGRHAQDVSGPILAIVCCSHLDVIPQM